MAERFAWMTPMERVARTKRIEKFFGILGVKADDERVQGYVDATAYIYWWRDGTFYFCEALMKVIQEKADGYQTAPQPGVIWEAFKELVPRSQWVYSGVAGLAPPRFYTRAKTLQARFVREPYVALPANVTAITRTLEGNLREDFQL